MPLRVSALVASPSPSSITSVPNTLSSENEIAPKSTFPFASFCTVVLSGSGAGLPSSSIPVIVKLKHPVISGGVSPFPFESSLLPFTLSRTGSPVEYVFTNPASSGIFAAAVNVPSPLSTTVTVKLNEDFVAVTPISLSPFVFSEAV